MKERVELQVQGRWILRSWMRWTAMLIDEARTPLIISGSAHDDAAKYRAADAVARVVIEKHRPWDARRKGDRCGQAGDQSRRG
jgi:preprotein translocase subunit SecA